MTTVKTEVSHLPIDAHERYVYDQQAYNSSNLPTSAINIPKAVPHGSSVSQSHLQEIPLLNTEKTGEAVAFSSPKIPDTGRAFSGVFYEKFEKAQKHLGDFLKNHNTSLQEAPQITQAFEIVVNKLAPLARLIESLKTVQKM